MSRPPISNSVLVVVWLCLIVLTAATFGVSKLSLGTSGEVLSLVIAVAKAALVAAVFMELRSSGYRVKMAGLAGLVWAAILFTFTFSDFFTRDWLETPHFWTTGVDPRATNNTSLHHPN